MFGDAWSWLLKLVPRMNQKQYALIPQMMVEIKSPEHLQMRT